MSHTADIIIIGAGIAGLWTFNHLKRLGYDVLLLESSAIGGGQTIASQGIIHSGLKYAFAGKINKLAQSISAMPDLWREALKGQGPVDLSAARMSANSQVMLVPSGLMGGLIKLVAQKTLGGGVREIPREDWPAAIGRSGFKGSLIHMAEPVLDIPSVVRALAEPYRDCIRLLPPPFSFRQKPGPPDDFMSPGFRREDNGGVRLEIDSHTITARKIVVAAAGFNHTLAKQLGHGAGLETQRRPLLMGLLKPAPFELYAHLVGPSDKPVATITTHRRNDGTLVWYLGGGVAEREKEADPRAVVEAAKKGFAQYLPDIDLSAVDWATLPIDRVEGKSRTDGWMPDTPTIHSAGNMLYCWPTKLTFAPLLSNRILEILEQEGITPSKQQTDWSFLPEVSFSSAPWDKVEWIKDNSEKPASGSPRSASAP